MKAEIKPLKLNAEEISALKKEFKGRGRILSSALQYLTHSKFYVNKQFDNKNFCIVTKSDNMLSESIMGLFKTKKVAIEFGKRVGMELIDEPK